MNGDALAEFAKQRLQSRISDETRADGRVTLEAVYCLGNCACAPAVMVEWRTAWACRRREALDGLCGRLGRARMSARAPVTVYVPGDAGAVSLGADARCVRHSRRECRAARAAGSHRAQRLARPVLAGAADRSGDSRGPRCLWSGAGRRCAAVCSTQACSMARRTRCGSAISRTHDWLRKSAAAHRRAARHRRSGRHRRLHRARRLRGPEHGARRCRRRTSCARSPTPACAAAAAPRFPPASSGRPCTISRWRRNTSPAMRTRAIRERSRIA